MSEQITAKQHVVPKFYLKHFTFTDGTFEVFDKQWKKFIGRKNPSAVGYDIHFYAQTTGKEDDISPEFEKILKSFEDFIAPQYDGICERILSNAQLTEQDRYTLATLAAMLWLRGYGMREQIDAMNSALMKRMIQFTAHHPNVRDQVREAIRMKEGREMTDDEVSEAVDFMRQGKYDIKGDNLAHLSMIGDYQGYTNLFFAQKLRIYIAGGRKRFITSDVPVMEMLPRYARERSFYGYGFPERLHPLPLSSEILLEFHDPTILKGKAVRRKRINDDMVAAANARQLTGAQRFCMGVDRDSFHAWRNLPGVPLLPVNRTGHFEESFLGMKVG